MMGVSKVNRAADLLISIVLGSVAVLSLYPLWYILVNSISSASEVSKGVYFIPRGITFANYKEVFSIPLVFTGVLVSTARAAVGSVLSALCSGFLGFLITNKDLPLRKLIYRMCVITMYITSGIIPWYMTMNNLGLKNSFLLYVLPSAVNGFYLILIKTYIESIPPSLLESAELDGAGVFTVFFRIVMPVSMPIVACVMVFGAVGQWNSWTDNMFLVNDKNLQTLQYILYSTMQSKGLASAITRGEAIKPMALRLTMTFITVAPVLLVYPFMQRFFVKGIMLGAVKG